MKTGPLQVKSIFFTEVHISNSVSPSPGENVFPELEVDPLIQPRKDGEGDWTIILRVYLKSREGTTASYVGEIETIGLFTVDETNWDPANSEKLVFINGSGILYSATREMVLNITSRGLFPPVTLPSCSFSQMFQDRENAKKAQESSASRPSAPVQPVPAPEPSPVI
jgi:preprotein translocase subunit SecB